MLKQAQNPDLYHGRRKKDRFFEGWYFKLVDAACKNVYIFIPGISLGLGGQDAHSFVQVFDGSSGAFEYISFPKGAFEASLDKFRFKVEKNTFSREGIWLDLKGSDFSISGGLSFTDTVGWPDSKGSPGSMGYYNYIPLMECYSQVCAMDLRLVGSLLINGKPIDFTGGRGYIEKNWGRAFPLGWIWVQCNNFRDESIALSASIGHVPFVVGSFRGFLIGLWVRGIFLEFSTMKKSLLDIKRDKDRVIIRVENRTHILKVDLDTSKALFINLKGPKDGAMVPLVDETVQGIVGIGLEEKNKGGGGHTRGNKVLVSDTGRCGGVEFGGEQMLIADP
ncbi:MAG TPA: tocopherol cyclase family protein [Bacillota bacterium]|nr:tocopherol cyclase family protein [Bacillota bacterium]